MEDLNNNNLDLEGGEESSAVEKEQQEGGSALECKTPVAGAIETENAALLMNNKLFEETPDPEVAAVTVGGFDDAAAEKLKPIWKRVVIATLLVVCAFAGAFFGTIYVCHSSIYKDSKFFDAFIAKWSGITENRIEVDYISGDYKGDAIELADKVLDSTVLVRTGYHKENGTFVQTSSGSGVIYGRVDGSSKYYIVTNYHVVAESAAIIVEIRGEGEEDEAANRIDAAILHLDERSDLAVLSIESEKELKVTTQADSSKAKHGQSIIVAGNPLGHGFAVSLGYISNPYRVTTANNNVPLMTLDATMNFGNSGGGVYDSAGNLIAVAVSKASGEDIDGIGYAIPINTVNEVVNDLLAYGYVKGRPALGVTVTGVYTPASYLSIMNNELSGVIFEDANPRYGVYILESKNNLLKKGDLIVSMGGSSITSTADISAVLLDKKPGNSISVTVERQSRPDPEGAVVYEQFTFNILLIERDFKD